MFYLPYGFVHEKKSGNCACPVSIYESQTKINKKFYAENLLIILILQIKGEYYPFKELHIVNFSKLDEKWPNKIFTIFQCHNFA